MRNTLTGTQTYKRLLNISKQYWFFFLLGVVGTLALSGSDALFSWAIKPVIDQGFIHRDAHFLKWLPLFTVVLFVLRGFAAFASGYYIQKVARAVVRDLRRKVFKKLLSLPASFYDQKSSAHMLSTIIYNVEQVADASSSALISVLQDTALVIGLLFVMFVINWKLASLFLMITPFTVLVVTFSSKLLKRFSANVQELMGEVTRIADEAIQGYKVIRVYGGQAYENSKFEDATQNNFRREMKIAKVNNVSTAVVQLLLSFVLAFILYLSTLTTVNVTAGAFVAIITSMVLLLRPIKRLTRLNSVLQKGIVGAASIFELIDIDSEKDQGTVEIERVRGEIIVDHVNFSYDNTEKPALQDITFAVKPGQTIAVVGHSGGGKTTLVGLLARFYDINQGMITVDGVDIKAFKLKNLRQQFSYVAQDTVLFDDTVANNIAYGAREKYSDEDIWRASEMAAAKEFIQGLPNGMETKIGEDGVLLSGGQRQRLAIARALLVNAPILILDEATSSLDTHSEKQIQAAMDRLIHNQTTIVIAHRLSTIESADWILVMDQGRLVEQGTHTSLYAQQGAYYALHSLQFQSEAATV